MTKKKTLMKKRGGSDELLSDIIKALLEMKSNLSHFRII